MMNDSNIRLPAEWESQSGILLTWPHNKSDWHDNLDEISEVYLEMCRAICQYEKILVICYDRQHKESIESLFISSRIDKKSYSLTTCKTNDTWCRDYGPITVHTDNKLLLNNFIFNGWGNKYQSNLDNAVSRYLYDENFFNNHEMHERDFVLEGGSIESDGNGTILTTSHCLLKRHPDKSRTDIERLLKETLGVTTVLWLGHGSISGDDTDNHIDNLARFANEHTIIYSACNNSQHPDFESLREMEQELSCLKQPNGNKYILVPLYLPETKHYEGIILPASYVNFLIINQAVLVPIFDDPQDEFVLEKLQQCFSNRNIIGIRSDALIKQLGGIHCASMQFPSGVLV